MSQNEGVTVDAFGVLESVFLNLDVNHEILQDRWRPIARMRSPLPAASASRATRSCRRPSPAASMRRPRTKPV
jgi:hypothetical protein